MFIIYKYTSPSGKHYVGLTKQKLQRKLDHKKKEKQLWDTSKFAQAVRKYGFNNFTYEEIDTALTLEEACRKEIHWIKYFDCIKNGYNICIGGTSSVGNLQYSSEEIEEVIHLLKNTEKSFTEIKEATGLSLGMISHLKNGTKRNYTPVENRKVKMKRGESNAASVLTEDQVRDIKTSLSQGVTRKSLCELYKVTKGTIQNIATGQTWAHVESDYRYDPTKKTSVKLTAEIVSNIRKDLSSGLSKPQVAEKYSISVPTVWQIYYRKTWKNVP